MSFSAWRQANAFSTAMGFIIRSVSHRSFNPPSFEEDGIETLSKERQSKS
jgi:hypothetical protein